MARYPQMINRTLTEYYVVDLQSIVAGDPFGMVPEEIVVLAIIWQSSHDSDIFDSFLTSTEELKLMTMKGRRQGARACEVDWYLHRSFRRPRIIRSRLPIIPFIAREKECRQFPGRRD